MRIPVLVTVIAVCVFKNQSGALLCNVCVSWLHLSLRSVVVTNNNAEKYVTQFDCGMHLEIYTTRSCAV
jgi:hypothetical protein